MLHGLVVAPLLFPHKVAVAAPAQGPRQSLAQGERLTRAGRAVGGAAVRLKHNLEHPGVMPHSSD